MSAAKSFHVDESTDDQRRVRSIFVSDLHLGSRFSRVELLLDLLQHHSPEYLYLVGDIVDGWCLKRKWHWPESYDRLLDRLLELAANGTTICFTPGNHDEFFRRFLFANDTVSIRNEFIHHTADNRRLMILHGDRFDDIETNARWLSFAGCIGYEIILRVDYWCNWMLRQLNIRTRRISQQLKRRVKLAIQFLSNFEHRAKQHARDQQCDAVICGHVHFPTLTHTDDVLYINLGDLVESGTALFEYCDGALSLIDIERRSMIAESPSVATSSNRSHQPMPNAARNRELLTTNVA